MNEIILVSSHAREFEEIQGGDGKRCAIDEKIEMLAVELFMLEKKAGKKETN